MHCGIELARVYVSEKDAEWQIDVLLSGKKL